MTLRGQGLAALALLGIAAGGTGCPSAYQRTYDRELQRKESQQQQETEQERAAHAEAQKYAAVAYFDVGSAALRPASQSELDWFVKQMEPYPKAMIEVNGFADSTGGEATNQQLSKDRADAVEKYLESKGIDSSRIVTQSFSTQFPAASNENSAGRRNNRRVEVTVR
ncbi:MAG TPA: OmpA family protein [Myxococcota bacterium]|nr:OmpA family protein [Myxococcota bacterium]